MGDGYFDEKMNAATDLKTANTLLDRLEGIEATRRGVSRRKARSLIARQVQASPGTLENLQRMRLKAVPSWLMSRIRAQLIAALQHQMRQLEHEIHLHLQTGVDPRENDLVAAQARLAEAKALIERNLR